MLHKPQQFSTFNDQEYFFPLFEYDVAIETNKCSDFELQSALL